MMAVLRFCRSLSRDIANALKVTLEQVNTLGTLRHPVACTNTNYLLLSYWKPWTYYNLTIPPFASKRQFDHSFARYPNSFLFHIPVIINNCYNGGNTPTPITISRNYSTHNHWRKSNKQTLTYIIAVAIAVVGLSYAAVPLYRIYCQASGYGGTVTKTDPSEKIEQMMPVEEREISIQFNADRNAGMRWTFKPQQREIKLVPGETALAFYTASNPTDEPITGIATYNVIPFDAGQYFNKIQCFCFEEQRLNPHEEVDMPVFFYIDPEFAEDPSMAKVDSITLSYTFFEAKDGETINIPSPTVVL